MKKILITAIMALLLACAGMKKANDFYQNKDYELAIKDCEQAIAKDSLNARAYLIMGKSYRALNKTEIAEKMLTRAYEIQPVSAVTAEARDQLIQIKFIRANSRAQQGKYYDAIAEYRKIIELDSTNFEAYFRVGNCYLENRLLTKARFYYQKAGKLDGAAPQVATQLRTLDSLEQVADSNFQKGKKFYLRKKNISARKYLRLALKNRADHQDAKYYLHLAEGKILYRKGSKSNCWDAIGHYGKAMMIRPDSAEPHFYMALAYEKKDRNEFDNAIDEYTIALTKEPNGPFAAKCKRKIRELKARRYKLKKFWGK